MRRSDSSSQEAAPLPTSVEEEAPTSELPPKLAELSVSAPEERGPAPLRLPALGLARIQMIEEDSRKIHLMVGGHVVTADYDYNVDRAVLKTAEERGEPVLVEQREDKLVIVGALRTQATPGIDKMAKISLEADEVEIKAKEGITMSSGVAAIAVRAIGEVETYAERIVSRAESVHKIIGRMLRLN